MGQNLLGYGIAVLHPRRELMLRSKAVVDGHHFIAGLGGQRGADIAVTVKVTGDKTAAVEKQQHRGDLSVPAECTHQNVMILQMDDAIHSVAGHALDIGVGELLQLAHPLILPLQVHIIPGDGFQQRLSQFVHVFSSLPEFGNRPEHNNAPGGVQNYSSKTAFMAR